MSKYITVAGDTFDSIAKKLFGDEKRAKELIEANPDRLTMVIFPAGVELVVPQITTSIDTASNSLPPWR